MQCNFTHGERRRSESVVNSHDKLEWTCAEILIPAAALFYRCLWHCTSLGGREIPTAAGLGLVRICCRHVPVTTYRVAVVLWLWMLTPGKPVGRERFSWPLLIVLKGWLHLKAGHSKTPRVAYAVGNTERQKCL